MKKLPLVSPRSAAGQVESGSERDRLIGDVERLRQLVEGWEDATQRSLVEALLAALEALHKEALVRLIREVKADPGGAAQLRRAAQDDVVYAVLRQLEILKPSLGERLERALSEVRPLLAQHGGDVELVSIDGDSAVTVRLLGACDGCPASGLTLREGVEKAIREACPQIETVRVARGRALREDGVAYISPFARVEDSGWQLLTHLEVLPRGQLRSLTLGERALIAWRSGEDEVAVYDDICAHMGLPLADGVVEEGILSCPHHGFRFELSSGECLTAPEAQLLTHAVRVVDERVEVRLL